VAIVQRRFEPFLDAVGVVEQQADEELVRRERDRFGSSLCFQDRCPTSWAARHMSTDVA
jgi:hypothetical protein